MLGGKVNQVKKTTVAQEIVQQLMELIINGTIGLGEKLPSEKELMELFGVGRSSLREAIRALAALGLVEVRVPEGTFVSNSFGNFFTKHLSLMSKISFDNIIELIEARLLLETNLAELAAKKSKPDDHKRLDVILVSMKNAVSSEDFLRTDLEFHTAIAEMANNSFLVEVMHILREITREWMHRVLQLPSTQEKAHRHHEKIAQAIKSNNEKLAGQAMKEHLQEVGDILLTIQGRYK